MKKLCFNIALITVTSFANVSLVANDLKESAPPRWGLEYQNFLMKKVGRKLPELATYPFYSYPNEDYESLLQRFPNGKVLVFGYGSLMNKQSAARSMKAEAIETMSPAVAFGVKRVFNYHANVTAHWGDGQSRKEKAMLNLAPTLNTSSLANGVTMEVDFEDLGKLVKRETGYDLVPILVSSWEDIMGENPELKIRVAYTFVATNELRNHIDYTSTEFYPVRGYLRAVQDASKAYGDDFAQMWNATTFLADGTTSINEWDGVTFTGILCTHTP